MSLDPQWRMLFESLRELLPLSSTARTPECVPELFGDGRLTTP